MKEQSPSIYDYLDYKSYLLSRDETWPSVGMRKALAMAMGCQAAYVSQVLKGSAHFSLEQAEAANVLLGHSEQESHFFLLLLQKERAGTSSLQKYFMKQMEAAKSRMLLLKNRFDIKERLKENDRATYYSDANYAAIHIALTIGELQTVTALAKRLQIPEKQALEVLEFLLKTGLAQKDGGKFKPGATRIHLGSDSKLVLGHHRNWRLKAIEDLSNSTDHDLHYSSIVSLSKSDFAIVREVIARAIERAKTIVRDSPEEDLAVFNVDFFKYKR